MFESPDLYMDDLLGILAIEKSATTTPVLLLVNRCTTMISQLSVMTPWVMLPTVSVAM